MHGGIKMLLNDALWLTSMVTKTGVLMIHHGLSSIVSQHLSKKDKYAQINSDKWKKSTINLLRRE